MTTKTINQLIFAGFILSLILVFASCKKEYPEPTNDLSVKKDTTTKFFELYVHGQSKQDTIGELAFMTLLTKKGKEYDYFKRVFDLSKDVSSYDTALVINSGDILHVEIITHVCMSNGNSTSYISLYKNNYGSPIGSCKFDGRKLTYDFKP